ncbi:MAG: hypothetical protein ACQEQJ_02905 [Halobacteriota archaeon]
MERRTFLRGIGVATLGVTAGCLGDDESEFMLRVVDQQYGAGEDGALTVWVTVSNPGNEAQSGTVYVRGDLEEDSFVRVREVELDAHETTELAIAFEIAYEDVGSFNFDSSVEPPESQ